MIKTNLVKKWDDTTLNYLILTYLSLVSFIFSTWLALNLMESRSASTVIKSFLVAGDSIPPLILIQFSSLSQNLSSWNIHKQCKIKHEKKVKIKFKIITCSSSPVITSSCFHWSVLPFPTKINIGISSLLRAFPVPVYFVKNVKFPSYEFT